MSIDQNTHGRGRFAPAAARHVAMVLGTLLLAGSLGCTAIHHKFEQSAMRKALLELNDEQIMDNLIRAKNNQSLLQIEYTSIDGTGTLTTAGDLGGTQTDTSGAITNFFKFNASGSHVNKVALTGKPVLGNAAVYKAYRDFVKKGRLERRKTRPTMAKDPYHVYQFRRETCKDASCSKSSRWPEHLHKWHYWVPKGEGEAYFALALRVSVLKGKNLDDDPRLRGRKFEREIEAVIAGSVRVLATKPIQPTATQPAATRPVAWLLTVRLDAPIPNDNGIIPQLVLRGKQYRDIRVRFMPKVDPGVGTKLIRIRYALGHDIGEIELSPDELAKEIAGKNVTFITDEEWGIRPPTPLDRTMDDFLRYQRTGPN